MLGLTECLSCLPLRSEPNDMSNLSLKIINSKIRVFLASSGRTSRLFSCLWACEGFGLSGRLCRAGIRSYEPSSLETFAQGILLPFIFCAWPTLLYLWSWLFPYFCWSTSTKSEGSSDTEVELYTTKSGFLTSDSSPYSSSTEDSQTGTSIWHTHHSNPWRTYQQSPSDLSAPVLYATVGIGHSSPIW